MTLNFVRAVQEHPGLTQTEKDLIINEFAYQHEYELIVEDAEGNPIPNPQTQVEYFNEVVTKFVRESVHAYRRQKKYENVTIDEVRLE